MKKSIYISRKVLNTGEIREWARAQGFNSCVTNDNMHITVAFDKKKQDWRELPLEADRIVQVNNPDERAVTEFNGGAIVLEVYSQDLTTRWAELTQSGLNWKWPDYRPHITITYKKHSLLVNKIEPFSGIIHLGPEIFDEVVWKKNIDEDEL